MRERAIPLFVLHQHWSSKPNYSFSKALRWFLLANRDGRYSGSSITYLNEDVKSIKEANDFDSAINKLMNKIKTPIILEESEFVERYDRADNRFLRLARACLMTLRSRIGLTILYSLYLNEDRLNAQRRKQREEF